MNVDYKPSCFYEYPENIDTIELIMDAVSKSTKIYIDERDNSVCRQKSDKQLDYIINIIPKSKYKVLKILHEYPFIDKADKFQIVLRLDDIFKRGLEYFLWIDVKTEYEQYFINKYELKEHH